MKKEFSIYLDIVRFMAAVLVVIFHSDSRAVIQEQLPLVRHFHAAVIVFFVLSGYVISYITATRERTPIDYWSSRFSRFYSLAIPIVLLCPLLDMAGQAMAPQFYGDRTTHDQVLMRILSSLTFTNEIWHVSIMSFSNVPYWSLCYEMWYYVLFALWMFTAGRARVVLMTLTCLFLGPKILLLAPVWVLGVMLHRSKRLHELPGWLNWTLFLGSLPAYALFYHFDMVKVGGHIVLGWVGPEMFRYATFSREFITDYLLALIIAANFVGFRGIAHHFSRLLLACERPVRWVSSFTFSLYILHQPFLLFYAAAINGDPAGRLFYIEVMAATLGTVWLIGSVTEHKRSYLRASIRRWLMSLTGSTWWNKMVTPLVQPKAG